MRKLFAAIFAAALLSQAAFAQGDNTQGQTATSWEEINFATNSAVLTDGFPSLLRLAELLKEHPDYKVNLAGNTDQTGGTRYNNALSLRRANAVRDFLVKYGANPNQIMVQGLGKTKLDVNANNTAARFMNRRVLITVTAPNGETIGDGSITAAINDFMTYSRAQLGKIDAIVAQLQQLETELRDLGGVKQDTAQLRQDTQQLRQDAQQLRQDSTAIRQDTSTLVQRPAPLTDSRTQEIARDAARDAANYALTQEAERNRKYAMVGLDAGPTLLSGRTGNYSAEMFGDALIPFGNGKTPDQPGTHGLQVDGDWVYFHPRPGRRDGVNDGIFDIGLVNRFNRIQLGTFAQFDYSSFNLYQGGGLLGAGIVTLDYIFKNGRIGAFGGKGFREQANISSTALAVTRVLPFAYMRYEDQVGAQGEVGLGSHFILDASIAYKKRYLPAASKVPAATVRVTWPVSNLFAFFVEGDQNTTIQNILTGDRAVVGIEFGNWLRPKDYSSTTGVVPVSVPRPHYELLTR